MSTRYFIAPFDPKAWEDPNDTSPKPTSDLSIEPRAYRKALVERWHDVTLSNTVGLSWELPPEAGEYGGLQGSLQSNNQIVSFAAGPKQSFIDFVLWHRRFVPEKYPLYLFNSSSWDSLKLTSETTAPDVAEFAGFRD